MIWPWHRHQWKAIAAKPYIAANPYTEKEEGPETLWRLYMKVLYACECGARKIKEFDGHWELKDFQ